MKLTESEKKKLGELIQAGKPLPAGAACAQSAVPKD
jgi:hypothetical protein